MDDGNHNIHASVGLDVDRPLDHPRDDLLGRKPLAESLARLISKRQATEGFVIALYGAWGSGKSTLLNFVEHYLKDAGTTPEDRQPVVIRFNPWWFHGPENLLSHFLRVFQEGLAPHKQYAKVAKLLGDYLTGLLPLAAMVEPRIGPLSRAWTDWCKRTSSPDEVRRRIDRILRGSSRQILVIVDDIDRLAATDIQQMFKLVKSVADFPKTIYLLAFDRGPVVAALNDVAGGRGEEYLHKIVQLEIDLPQPDPTMVRHLAVSGLERVLGDVFRDAFSPGDLEDLHQEAMRHILRTMRDVKRYLNAVSVTYPFVKEEVHPGDFALAELLRIFAPSVYDAIRSNRERFAGGDSELEAELGGGTPQERKPYYDEVVDGLPVHLRTATLAVLKRLFPKVRASYGALPSASSLDEQWRRERRVCSPDVFPYYFQLSVPIGEVSEETFRALCRTATDRARFSQELLELAKPSQPGEVPRSRLLSFLQRLRDHPETIKSSWEADRLQASIGALFDVGDPIYGEDWDALKDSRVDDAIVEAVSALLDEGAGLTSQARALAEAGNFNILRDTLASTSSLYVPTLYISCIRRLAANGRGPVHPSHLDELRRLLCEKIDRAADDLTLAKVPRLLFVLTRWEEWCPDRGTKRKRFVERLLQTEEGVGRLLAGYLKVLEVSHGPEQSSRVEYEIDLRELSHDVGDRNAVNSLYTRVTQMSQESLSQLTLRGRTAIDTFRTAWLRAGSQIPITNSDG
jgi:energy-coupling factor transporter ATP-binding protein EcfA2